MSPFSVGTYRFALALVACGFTGGSSLAEVTLVRDGRPTSVIVTNGRPQESHLIAAKELQEHLRLMSGATVPISKENELDTASSDALILIGQCNRSQKLGVNNKHFQGETFVVKTVGNALVLAGDDGGSKKNARKGSLWATYDFLQDHLGCRWIWPGETGRHVPKRQTITIPDLDIRETPVVQVRFIRMLAQEKHRIGYEKEGLGKHFDLNKTYDKIADDERVWIRRMRLGRSFKLSYGHAFTDWWKKYKDSHPDVFAMQSNGVRGPRKKAKPDFVKMCVSNPALWDLQLELLIKNAAKGTRSQSVNTCENDGSGGFCICQTCRSWDSDASIAKIVSVEDGSEVDGGNVGNTNGMPDSLSDRYSRWYNELAIRAKKHDPQSRIIAYAYGRYRSPPTLVDKIEPNVWIGYVGFNAYPRPESYRKQSADEWLGWSKLGATVFLRSNSLFYCGEGAPYVASHQMADDLKFQIANGMRATDYDALQGYWSTTGPTYYVLARMLWDSEADVDQILDEYYESFGPMKDVVKDYYNYWELFTTRLGNSERFMAMKRMERMKAYPLLYRKEIFAKAEAILARGNALLAKATEDERERFRNVHLGLQHGQLLTAALQDGKTSSGAAGKRLLDFRKEIAHRNVLNVYWVTSKEKRYGLFD